MLKGLPTASNAAKPMQRVAIDNLVQLSMIRRYGPFLIDSGATIQQAEEKAGDPSTLRV